MASHKMAFLTISPAQLGNISYDSFPNSKGSEIALHAMSSYPTIYDNIEALQVVMDGTEHRNVDAAIHLGNIVGYYQTRNRAIKVVRTRVCFCVAGNYNYVTLGRIDTRDFT